MISRFTPHLEILPPNQSAIWNSLLLLKDAGYVLYGGTAIALRFGHRQSVDFDFFSDLKLSEIEIVRALPFLKNSAIIQQTADSLTYLVKSAGIEAEEFVKVSFFGGISFGRVGAPELTSDGIIHVASAYDLMATKLKVLLQRIEAKDYRDISSLIEHGCSLATGLSAARTLFGKSFPPGECLKALTYFEGGDLDALPEKIRRQLILSVSGVEDLPAVEKISEILRPFE